MPVYWIWAYFYLLTYCVSVNAFFDTMDLYECFKYKFSQNDGRRRIFSFYRKIYKAAPILISGWFYKSFSFTLLALCDGTTAQLQIYSSERNIRLLPVDWRKDKFKIEAANSEDWRKDKFKIGGRKIL